MDKNEYQKLVKEHTPKEDRLKNALKAFVSGGCMGLIGQGLLDLYKIIFQISDKEAGVYMIITLIFLGCFLTALGVFDKIVNYFRCGLIVPITGFAHSMQSAAIEYKREGFITGLGANMFKLSGSVILYGIVSAYAFGLLRLVMGW